MRATYFYLPEYPEAPTGGIKYHKILYEYFRKNSDKTYLLGNNRFSKQVDKNKLLKIIFGIIYSVKVKRKAVIVLSNTAFLHFMIPMLVNKFYKRHYYFMIVHHLVRSETPEFFRTMFEEYFIKHSDYVMTVSETTRNEMMKYGLLNDENIKIIPPGLDEVKHPKKEIKNIAGKNQILFVGTLEERKGVIHLIEAFRYLRNKDAELHIIGASLLSGVYSEFLNKKVKEYHLENRIFFRGRVSETELEQYYVNSSIFVFPSLWEGYGMVVAEAMSHSLPVIATNIPALKELIDDGINGFLVNPAEPEILAEKIDRLLCDEELLKSFSEAAYIKSKSFQTWEKTNSDIYKIIDQI